MELKQSFFKKNLIYSIIFSCTFISINTQISGAKSQGNIDIPQVVSFRSASCGCCKKWLNYLRANGLKVLDNVITDVNVIKKQYAVPNNLKSCHSAEIGNYIIEGHVPIESINKLFKKKPRISGVAVPGMPHGSPGMEKHSHKSQSHNYESYEVISFTKSGTQKIFDKIST